MWEIKLNVGLTAESVKKISKCNKKQSKWKRSYRAKRKSYKVKTKVLWN